MSKTADDILFSPINLSQTTPTDFLLRPNADNPKIYDWKPVSPRAYKWCEDYWPSVGASFNNNGGWLIYFWDQPGPARDPQRLGWSTRWNQELLRDGYRFAIADMKEVT